MRYISRPQPGHYTVSAYRKGPKLPARIWRECICTVGHGVRHDWTEACDRRGELVAEINGERVDVERVWHYGWEWLPTKHHPEAAEPVDYTTWRRLGIEYLDHAGRENVYV